MSKKKTIILLDHYGGRLGNQLWPFAALYAYCLARGYELRNYCFSNYASDFDIPVGNWLLRLFFYSPLKDISFRKWSPLRHWLFPRYVNRIKSRRTDILDDAAEVDSWRPFYLPPTVAVEEHQIRAIADLEASPEKKAYVNGWMYRNPVGMEKYHKEIVSYFRPRKHVRDQVAATLREPRGRFKHVVGVHLRLGDYRYVEDKVFFFEPTEVRKMLDQYVSFSGLHNDDVCFVICSDETLDPEIFKGLNIFLPTGTPVKDLFTLAATDIIIGSNSTFGPFAAYYGNIPFVVFEREGIDWEWYRGKKGFVSKPTRVFY